MKAPQYNSCSRGPEAIDDVRCERESPELLTVTRYAHEEVRRVLTTSGSTCLALINAFLRVFTLQAIAKDTYTLKTRFLKTSKRKDGALTTLFSLSCTSAVVTESYCSVLFPIDHAAGLKI